jgi:DNA repair protein RadA
MGSHPTFTSGSSEIDELLGGGLKGGKLTMAYGKSNSGKTQLAMQAALCASHAEKKSLFIDTEGTFRPERIEEMARSRGWETGTLLNRIVYLRCSSSAMQVEAVRRISKRQDTSGCELVVIDTLTRNFTLDLPGSENMPDRQGALNVHLSEISRDAFLHGRAYLLTNRVTFDKANMDVGIGGNTVAQLVHDLLHLEREPRKVKVTCLGTLQTSQVPIGPKGIG